MDDALDHLSKCRAAIFAETGNVDLTDLDEAGVMIGRLQEISRMVNAVEQKMKEYQEEYE